MRPCLCIPLIGLWASATAQFAPPGAQWTYDQEGGLYTMSVVGDTVLSGHPCSIIQGSSPSICWQSQAYTYQNGDTVFWSDDQYLPHFFELYRWNAQPGESWDVWTNGPVTVTYTVLSTGTTNVNGQTLRTLNVEATDTQLQWAQSSGVLVEHIGDTLFLFPWLAAFCDAIPPWPLRCYTDDVLGTTMRPGVVDCQPASATVFAPVGATWTYSQHFAWGPDSAVFTLACTGDTVINGRTCSVLQAGTTDCFHPYNGGKAITYASGDSVFVQSSNGFSLLYAFNAPAGSSWDIPWSALGALDTIRVQVISVVTEVIDGIPLRVLETESTMIYEGIGPMWPIPARIIERLGHSIYHFFWGFEACDMDMLGPLRCYTDPDITWLNPQFPQCELSVGVAEHGGGAMISLRPNPVAADDILTIRSRAASGPHAIEVRDALGRTVSAWTLPPDGLDLHMPGPGLFLITARDAVGATATYRVIVR